MLSGWRQLKEDPFEIMTLFLALLFAVTFTLEVVTDVLTGEEPQTFRIASAAILALGALAGIGFAYASLVAGDASSKERVIYSSVQLFYSIVLVVIAAGTEWFLRLYITPAYAPYGWPYWTATALLAVGNTLFFWRANVFAYRGVMTLKDTLWALLQKSNVEDS